MLRSSPLLLVLMVACAQQVGDVDRTQANRLKKAALEGEWYYRQTVIDVPFSAGFTFVGETSGLERVRWEISQDYVTAYRVYEHVRDAEKPYALPGTHYQGEPVAQFRVVSHFDVKRGYNPSTGEQTNVLDENTQDRKWNERAYLRVDWSQNLVTNFTFMADQVLQSPTPFYVNDPADPDSWFVAVREGSEWSEIRDERVIGQLESFDYLDLVTKVFATPALVDYYGDGSYLAPACYFYSSKDCAPAEVKFRNSFMKVQGESDYEELPYPDNFVLRDSRGKAVEDGGDVVRIPLFDRFGFFRTERDSYDRDRGVTESGRLQLINRWNLWQRSSFQDGKSIPFNQRELKPIVYHLSPAFPEELKEEAQALVAEWNKPLEATVNVLVGGKPQLRSVFELRDNTYQVGSDGRIVNYGQRMGDLRYSMLYWVDQPQSASPLGYGPPSADPVTGELISASAYIYGASIDLNAQFGTDVVGLLNGRFDVSKLIGGEVSAEMVAARLQARGYTAKLSSPAALERSMPGSLLARLDSLKTLDKESLLKDPSHAESRLHALDNRPELVAKLLDQELLTGLRENPLDRSPPTADELRKLSPAAWLSRAALDREQRRVDKLSRHCVYLAEFADDSVLGLARELKRKSDPADPLFEAGFDPKAYIRSAIFTSVATHEVGHTLGLRHNFEGSYDALNFSRRFWELNGANATPLDVSQTQTQIDGRMREYQYSSVMDYGSRFNADTHGIGRYDQAAIRFGYGLLVDAFKQPPALNADNHRMALFRLDSNFMRRMINYTSIPKFFGGLDVIDQRQAVPLATLLQQQLSGSGSLQEVPYMFCSDEYAGGTPTCSRWDQGMDSHEIVAHAADSYERYYYFNSFKRDRRYFSPRSYMSRIYARYFTHFQSHYQHWVFRQFSDSSSWAQLFDIEQCYNTKTSPETECTDLQSASFWLSLKRLIPKPIDLVKTRDWNLDPDGGGALSAATMEGINALFGVLTTPEPGAFVDFNDFKQSVGDPDPADDFRADNKLVNVSSSPNALEDCTGQASIGKDARLVCKKLGIGLGDGRFPYSNYDVDSGYHYFEKILWIGSFYDKLTAILALTDPSTNFLGVDTASDVRRFAIGYNLIFPQLMHRFFTSIVTEKLDDYAPRGSDNQLVRRPPFPDPMELSQAPADFDAGALPAVTGGVPLDVANNFTVRIYTLLYGMAYFSSTFSPAFLDAAQVCVRGNGECNVPEAAVCDEAGAAPTASTCWQFTSPFNRKTYVAPKAADPHSGVPVTTIEGVGPLLLDRAAKLFAQYDQAADAYELAATPAEKLELRPRLDFAVSRLTNAIEDLEVVRGFYDAFGLLR